MGSLNRCRMFDSSGRRSFLIAGKQLHEIPVRVSDERDPQSGLGCVAGRPNRAAARLHTRMRQCCSYVNEGSGMSLDRWDWAAPYRVDVSDRDRRVIIDLNDDYLNAWALRDIERLGLELRDGSKLTGCMEDEDDEGNPTWLVVEFVASFDPKYQAWRMVYTDDDIHWEPREP